MQSPTPPPSKPKKNSPFVKWLPAIVLALVIHGVLIYFFLNSQKNTTAEVNATANYFGTSTVPEDLNNEKEGLLTLQQESASSEKQQLANKDKQGEEKQDKTVEQETEDKKNEEDNAQAKATIDNNSESEKDIGVNNGADSKPNQAENKNRAPTQQQSLPMDSPSYLPPAQPNPNDQVLLPRDLPKAEQKVIGQDTDYAKAAEQSEDLSDKLSTIVNDVKEQKLRQIEAQQRASKEAYLGSMPATANSATEKTAPAKPVIEMTVPENPATEKPVASKTEPSTAAQ